MRTIKVLVCFWAVISAVMAADPAPSSATGTFLVARDRDIAEFKARPSTGQDDKSAVQALADLDRLLRAAVPAWTAPGFPATGDINLSALDDNQIGFSVLNGLIYNADTTSVIVTNRALLLHWLADHNNWNDTAKVPVSIPAAFRAENFWTFAFGPDAAAQLRAEVQVKAPAGTDLAVAELALFAQYTATDRDADTLLVAVVRGDRVFIAKQKLTVTLERPAICKKPLDQTLAKSAAALKDYQDSLKGKPAGKTKDITRFSDHIALKDTADREYSACFAQHLNEQPGYAAVQKQAQTLVDLLH